MQPTLFHREGLRNLLCGWCIVLLYITAWLTRWEGWCIPWNWDFLLGIWVLFPVPSVNFLLVDLKKREKGKSEIYMIQLFWVVYQNSTNLLGLRNRYETHLQLKHTMWWLKTLLAHSLFIIVAKCTPGWACCCEFSFKKTTYALKTPHVVALPFIYGVEYSNL